MPRRNNETSQPRNVQRHHIQLRGAHRTVTPEDMLAKASAVRDIRIVESTHFYGYDLNSGIFPSSEIVGYKLAALDPELKTLLMATKQNNDIVEVTLSGNGDMGIKAKGSWTFANNLLQHGSKK